MDGFDLPIYSFGIRVNDELTLECQIAPYDATYKLTSVWSYEGDETEIYTVEGNLIPEDGE